MNISLGKFKERGILMKVYQIRIKLYLLKDIMAQDVQIMLTRFIDKSLFARENLGKLHNINTYKNYCYDLLSPLEKDKIYKIEPTEENIEIIRKENKIPTESNIVCQEGEIKDNLKQEQKGYHQYLLVKDDLREYHSYNNMVESGYFETFIWERNIGLKYYKSGYGAEFSLVELELLNE